MTILELARELGVTKEKIKYLQRKLDPSLYSKDTSGRVVLSDEAVRIIRERLGTPHQGKTDEKPVNNQGVDPVYQALLDQLAAKDQQIDRLQQLLAMEKAEKAQLLQLAPPAQSTPQQKKPGLLARLFGTREQ